MNLDKGGLRAAFIVAAFMVLVALAFIGGTSLAAPLTGYSRIGFGLSYTDVSI